MIRVIIVDDEYLVRERIKSCLDWNGMGFEIAGEASNGEDALELVKRVRPGLAIVDINMPFVNGLDFSRIVYEKYPETKVIILTGYGFFEYAVDAIQAGVACYLLKPVNSEELAKALEDLKSRIEKEAKFTAVSRDRFIEMILGENAGNPGEPIDMEKFSYYCPSLRDDRLAVIIALAEDRDGKGSLPQSTIDAVFDVFNRVFARTGCFTGIIDSKKRLVFLVNAKDVAGKPIDYISLCEEAVNGAVRISGCAVTAGIGNEYGGINEACSSYKEASIALKNRIILGKDKVIRFEALSKGIDKVAFIDEIKNSLLYLFRLGDVMAVQDKISEVFGKIREDKLNLDYLYMAISEMLFCATCFANEMEINISCIVNDTFDSPGIVERHRSLEGIEKWIFDIFTQLMDLSRNKYSHSLRIVEKAKSYIEANYSNENLCLEDIANYIFISQSYLSNIFKKEMGISIVEYLTKLRMEMAKKLIDQGDNVKLEGIAYAVGYNSPYYFSRCFKKYFGISPAKYIMSKKIVNR